MRRIFQIIVCTGLFYFLNSTSLVAQSVVTDTLTVNGVCGMCEKRIEKAAFVKGVKMAEWDKNVQKLVLVYKPKKTNLEAISKAVAKVGHDTELAKAPQAAYDELPDCCAYRDGVKPH